MLNLLLLLLACGDKGTDSGDPQDDDTATNQPSEEPSGEPGGEPSGEPGGEPAAEPGGEPGFGESPDDFPSTCTADSMENVVTAQFDDASYNLTEAVWDIEEFGFMTIVLGEAGSASLCDRVLDGSFENTPNVVGIMTGQGGLSSSDSYSMTVEVTDGDPGMEYASVSFEDGMGAIEAFGAGTIEISSYTYGADMTLSFSIGDEDDTLSATDISACYCPGALEVAADF